MRASVQALILMVCLLTSPTSTATPPPELRFVQGTGALHIEIGGQRVGFYVWDDAEIPRPHFSNLYTLDGIPVTRTHPPDPLDDAKNTDHAEYHPGVWLAFGDLGGADFWRNKARVRHDGFLEAPEGGPGRGRFAVRNVYERDGKPLCEERCVYTITVYADGYLIRSETVFTAVQEGLAFGDQEEMGFGVRLATPLTVRHGDGQLLNSEGGVNESGTWGKRAAWCAGFGERNGRTVGVSVMADPGNLRPSWFHSRDYGLIVANPFGKKAMTAPLDHRVAPDSTPLPADTPMSLGFGVYVFSLPPNETPGFNRYYETYTSEAADE